MILVIPGNQLWVVIEVGLGQSEQGSPLEPSVFLSLLPPPPDALSSLGLSMSLSLFLSLFSVLVSVSFTLSFTLYVSSPLSLCVCVSAAPSPITMGLRHEPPGWWSLGLLLQSVFGPGAAALRVGAEGGMNCWPVSIPALPRGLCQGHPHD